MFHIVGTNHALQHDGNPNAPISRAKADKARAQLKAYLHGIADAIHPTLIAEELSEWYLTEIKKGANSIAKTVADELCLSHCFCDPDCQERERFGLPCLADNGTPQAVILALFKECYWFMRLAAFRDQTVLFVCGADHVVSFSRLLRSRDVHVKVHRRYFGKQLLKAPLSQEERSLGVRAQIP